MVDFSLWIKMTFPRHCSRESHKEYAKFNNDFSPNLKLTWEEAVDGILVFSEAQNPPVY